MTEKEILQATRYENIKKALTDIADNFEGYLERADNIPLFLLDVEMLVEKSAVQSYAIALYLGGGMGLSKAIGRGLAKNFKGYPTVYRETRKFYILPELDEIRVKFLPYYKQLILPDKKKLRPSLKAELDRLEKIK